MELTHVGNEGQARIVDVSAKLKTVRKATARAQIIMKKETLEAIVSGNNKKGDVFAAARIAGIMAAKRTHELIPLCHPIPITSVEVELLPLPPDRINIIASAGCNHETGVEMEALTAASIAALTVYDMAKAIDKEMQITGIELVEKVGGKSGTFVRSSYLSEIYLPKSTDERQFSAVYESAISEIEYAGFPGLCMKKFHADLVIADEDQKLLKKGNILRIGKAVLEVTSEEKHCYPDDCDFYGQDTDCPLKKGCAFLRVISPGRVFEGAKIMIEAKDD